MCPCGFTERDVGKGTIVTGSEEGQAVKAGCAMYEIARYFQIQRLIC